MRECDTQVWNIDPFHPEPEMIRAAARIVLAGGLVAFPTETVYGLGANALDPEAVRQIYVAKGRPSNNPIIVHVAGIEGARTLVSVWPDLATQLAAKFWPGPLTLVLPRSNRVPDIITGGGATVAVRCPLHPVALALIRAAGVPIAAPSANRSSELSPTRAEHVLRGLNGRMEAILDGGPTSAGIESTVIDLCGSVPRLLRPGPISPGELERFIGRLERGGSPSAMEAPLPSPGLLARHYAPRTRLECWPTEEGMRERARALMAEGRAIGIVGTEDVGLEGAKSVVLPSQPQPFAAELYRVLHELDNEGLDRILVLLPPATDDWLAVRDRLVRASCFG